MLDWIVALTAINLSALGEPEVIMRLVLQIILFCCSACFSMSETALFSLREAELQRLEQTRHPRVGQLRSLLDQPRQLIVSILCGNELVNIFATINLAGLFLTLYDNPGTAGLATTLVMVPLLLIFAEITPKTAAVTHPVAISTKLIAPALSIWVRLVAPLRVVIRFISDRVTTCLIGDAGRAKTLLGMDEFQTLLRDVEKEGIVTKTERRLITNLIQAGSTEITQIMVPRPRIAFIDAELPIPDMLRHFQHVRHRRVPLYRGQRDNIVGELKEHTVLRVLSEKNIAEITLADLIEPATLVPPTQTVSELAEFFKAGDHHAVIVVNEFGGVEGLISADDVFGFLTQGRAIHLESDIDIEEIKPDVYQCSGLTPLYTLRRVTAFSVADPRISTVGGLVMVLLNRMPTAGDEAVQNDIVFRVLSMDHLRVDRVLIAPVGHASLTATHEETVA